MLILKNLENLLKGIQERRNRLIEMYMDGLRNDQNEYRERKSKITKEGVPIKKI